MADENDQADDESALTSNLLQRAASRAAISYRNFSLQLCRRYGSNPETAEAGIRCLQRTFQKTALAARHFSAGEQ